MYDSFLIKRKKFAMIGLLTSSEKGRGEDEAKNL